MFTTARKKFFMIMGNNYEESGHPQLCGWIEALFLIEPRNWTQKQITKRLSELFPDSDYPTSLASVNRALKLLVQSCVLIQSGSRKGGYSYHLVDNNKRIEVMFQPFILKNESLVKDLSFLINDFANDSDLRGAIASQLKTAKIFLHVLKEMLTTLNSSEFG